MDHFYKNSKIYLFFFIFSIFTEKRSKGPKEEKCFLKTVGCDFGQLFFNCPQWSIWSRSGGGHEFA